MTMPTREIAVLGDDSLHVVIDMQRLFAEPTEWRVPSLGEVVPPILQLADAHPAETVFTRFVTPVDPDSAPGQWRHYYARWRSVIRDRMGDAMLDLVEPLQARAAATNVFDKATYSAFGCTGFVARLAERRPRSLILTGVETDVCILATAIQAVDQGYAVVIASDAVTSSSPAGHHAALEHVLPRLDQQVQIATTAEILQAWPRS